MISIASACVPWLRYVAFFTSPPLYPTRVEMTPGCLRIRSCMPQKQPPARIACSCVAMRLLLSLILKYFAIFAVACSFEFVERDETERRRVDAVAQPALVARAVIKQVAKMAVGVRRAHFGANHAVRGVGVFLHVFGLDRLGEARPPAMAVKFIERRKQRLARNDIHVNPRLLVIVKFVLKRTLGGALLRHPVLLGSQPGNRFLIFCVLGHNSSLQTAESSKRDLCERPILSARTTAWQPNPHTRRISSLLSN